jgi:hypothetical protein
LLFVLSPAPAFLAWRRRSRVRRHEDIHRHGSLRAGYTRAWSDVFGAEAVGTSLAKLGRVNGTRGRASQGRVGFWASKAFGSLPHHFGSGGMAARPPGRLAPIAPPTVRHLRFRRHDPPARALACRPLSRPPVSSLQLRVASEVCRNAVTPGGGFNGAPKSARYSSAIATA